MSLRSVQRQAAARYGELGADLSSTLRPQQPIHRTNELTTTARLLRNSRLFSLPKPLKRPTPGERLGDTQDEGPNTATLPYPTHAAIVTHANSFTRGDWGLKRALPSRAFRTTTPTIRVNQVDSIDHITEFESAADHVITLQKVQEMSIPMVLPQARNEANLDGIRRMNTMRPSISAFEEFCDPKQRPKEPGGVNAETYKPTGWGTQVDARQSELRRWRFDGPWIAGMPAGDFQAYVTSTIKNKRVEFRTWLRSKLAAKRSQTEKAKRSSNKLDAGLGAADGPDTNKLASQILADVLKDNSTPAKDTIEADMLDLRNHPRELFALIWEFLDLPGRLPSFGSDLSVYAEDNYDVEHGPPVTHPSAGLSYLRPVRQLYNHPALGPMAEAPPVPARQLQRKSGIFPQVYGVAGVAVIRQNERRTEGQSYVEWMQEHGGPKIWANVDNAAIDSKGRIKLNIRTITGNTDQVDVWNPKPREDSNKRAWGSSLPGRNRMPALTSEPQYKKRIDLDA